MKILKCGLMVLFLNIALGLYLTPVSHANPVTTENHQIDLPVASYSANHVTNIVTDTKDGMQVQVAVNEPIGSGLIWLVNSSSAPETTFYVGSHIIYEGVMNSSDIAAAFSGPSSPDGFSVAGSNASPLSGKYAFYVDIRVDEEFTMGPNTSKWIAAVTPEGGFQLPAPDTFRFSEDGKVGDGPEGDDQHYVDHITAVHFARAGVYNNEPIPEPATLLILGPALLGIFGLLRKRKNR
jgi:hypothetical protein